MPTHTHPPTNLPNQPKERRQSYLESHWRITLKNHVPIRVHTNRFGGPCIFPLRPMPNIFSVIISSSTCIQIYILWILPSIETHLSGSSENAPSGWNLVRNECLSPLTINKHLMNLIGLIIVIIQFRSMIMLFGGNLHNLERMGTNDV